MNFVANTILPNQPSIESLTKQVEQLTFQVSFLMNRVEELSKENLILQEKLAKYENPKNSRNSSIPPSQDSNQVAYGSFFYVLLWIYFSSLNNSKNQYPFSFCKFSV